ncbi:MAG: phospholipid carrier-dependent glycosyltransferase [Thermoguttaceae bacterium]|jgi:4-amino-4-deoxy-L-arabinose transferase-like glycosyltransferase|nr:phospholipid carrier-dependent glycosyltransferase [Thermoguttaceae bacterium]
MRTILLLVSLTLLVRGGAMLAAPDALRDDVDRYRAVAENLYYRGVFATIERPTAYRPPLYPVLLVPAVALGAWSSVGIAALHLALGVGTVLLTWRLGQQAQLGGWAWVAAALVACDPILVRQSTLVMTETPAAFFAAAGLVALGRATQCPSAGRAAPAGGCLAAASLCRPTFLPWLAACALALPCFVPTTAQRLKVFALFVLAAAVVLSPWTLRNYARFGKPIVSTTHGGYNLLLGNNPFFYEYLRSGAWGTAWFSGDLDRQWLAEIPASETDADRKAYDEAWRNIRAEPGMFAYACLVRVARLFSPFPHQTDPHEGRSARALRYAAAAWYVAELPLALAGAVAVGLAWRAATARANGEPWAPWLWAGLLVLTFVAVHAFYWTDLRMRAPLMPALALAAARGAGWLAGAIGRRCRPWPGDSCAGRRPSGPCRGL